jgi:hypothetical protein
MLRIGEICRRLGCQKSALYQNYIRSGRLKMYPLGVRTVGALEADVERLVAEIVSGGAIATMAGRFIRAGGSEGRLRSLGPLGSARAGQTLSPTTPPAGWSARPSKSKSDRKRPS